MLGHHLAELFADFALPRHQRAHQAGFKVDAVLGHIAIKQAFGRRKVKQVVQDHGWGVQVLLRNLARIRRSQVQQVKQGVACDKHIHLFDERVPQPEAKQPLNAKGEGIVPLSRGQFGSIGGGFPQLLGHTGIPPTVTIPHFALAFHAL